MMKGIVVIANLLFIGKRTGSNELIKITVDVEELWKLQGSI
jgi:hypothetical protein